MTMKNILKLIYDHLPFKKQVFLCIRAVFSLPSSLYQHLHFKGIFRVKINEQQEFVMYHHGYLVENEVFWKGLYENEWESVSLKYWTELSKDSKCIIDVGANTGIYSLVARTVNPSASVIAFEPVKKVYEMLLKNKQLNNFNILCVEKALSDFNGQAIIYDDPNRDHTYSVTVNKNLTPENKNVSETKIEAIRLDSFIEQHQLPKIDLMKIDVETHEPEMLAGFGVYLENFQPAMLIEILNDEVALKIEHLIKNIPYLYFNINERTGAKQVGSLTKSDNYNFLLCSKETAVKLGLIG
jgi:FkbM family methyltransferase